MKRGIKLKSEQERRKERGKKAFYRNKLIHRRTDVRVFIFYFIFMRMRNDCTRSHVDDAGGRIKKFSSSKLVE